jgi:hypothetical protein
MLYLRILPAVLVCAAMMFLATGCSNDEEGNNGGPSGNPDSLVTQANAALENILYELANGNGVEQPEDIDFTEAYNLYQAALNCDNQHTGANFGAGVLEVVMLTRNPQVQDFFDRLTAFLDSGSYFEVSAGAAALGGKSLSVAPVLRFRDFSMPVLTPLTIGRRLCGRLDENEPTVAELQSICLNYILPRITTAIQRLTIVAANETFTFMVTPRMQGDPDEDPVELDQTEIRLTVAALDGMAALLNQFCAYNLNFPSYDGAAMQQAFSQGSSFAALVSGGANRMATARQAWLDALDQLGSAIYFLEHETDDQSNDAIRIDPYDDLTQADLDSVMHYLPLIRQCLTSSQTFALDTDNDPWTPPENIEISLAALFNDPITDFKDLFPTYTVSLDTQEVETDWVYDEEVVAATVQIPQEGYYYWNRNLYMSNGVVYYQYADTNGFSAPAWNAAFDQKVVELSAKPFAHVSLYFYGYLVSGTQTLNGYLSYSYEEPARERFTPRITWQANSFAQWILPDPTMNGIFPGMTDARFKSLFGLTAEHWHKTTAWYLW